jgi:hypothetical protein
MTWISLSSQPDTGHRLSVIFFVSILIASGIYAVAIAIESMSAGDLMPGLITLAILIVAIAATAILHVPDYFSSNFSSTTASLLAIAVSTLGLLLAITNAASFTNLPEHKMTSPGVQSQRVVSVIGVVSFSLALVINVMVALIVPRRSAGISS